MSGCNDPIVEMAMTAFASLMLLATQIDNRNEEEQKAMLSTAMDLRTIDLKPLLPNMKNCDQMCIRDSSQAMRQAGGHETDYPSGVEMELGTDYDRDKSCLLYTSRCV